MSTISTTKLSNIARRIYTSVEQILCSHCNKFEDFGAITPTGKEICFSCWKKS